LHPVCALCFIPQSKIPRCIVQWNAILINDNVTRCVGYIINSGFLGFQLEKVQKQVNNRFCIRLY